MMTNPWPLTKELKFPGSRGKRERIGRLEVTEGQHWRVLGTLFT